MPPAHPGLRWLTCVGVLLAWAPLRAVAVDEDPLPPAETSAANPPRDWAGWMSVPALVGESHSQLSSETDKSGNSGDVNEERAETWSVVRFTLALDQEQSRSAARGSCLWRVVEASGSAGVDSSWRSLSKWRRSEGETAGSFAGTMSLRTRPALELKLSTGRWAFMTLHETGARWTQTTSGSVQEHGRNETSTSHTDSDQIEHGYVQGGAPKQSIGFGGTQRDDLSGQAYGKTSAKRVTRVQFWPDWDDVEVFVEIRDYARWRPRGNLDDPAQPGPEPLEITATLRPKAKEPTPEQLRALPAVRRFRFEISDTSREPGVCMNWPSFGPDASSVPPEDPEPDLRFEPMPQFKAVLSPKRQKCGVRAGADDLGRPTAQARLGCYDFGAHADLRVVAELVDGREVTGFLDTVDGPHYVIRIPDRPDGSLIARAWREAEGVADSTDASDDDDRPKADGQKGDGFSLYEEYRGFAVHARHVSLKPAIKDLFVLNLFGSEVRAGFDLFEEETGDGGERGFTVHDRLWPSEMPDSREMNINRSARSPRRSREPQHGLTLVPLLAGTASKADFDDKQDEVAWRPKNVKTVRVLAWLSRSNRRDFVSTIAHEISHAVGARHHGGGDPRDVVWDLATDNNGNAYFRESEPFTAANGATVAKIGTGQRVRLFFEDGRQLDPNHPKAAEIFGTAVPIYVGTQRGEHAGDDQCWMRYDCAGAYIPPGRSRDRIVVQFPADAAVRDEEPPGLELCSSATGTGVNDPARKPPAAPDPSAAGLAPPAGPRYGTAALGNCREQMCVRDDAPDRMQPKAP